jgi:hypothetical protein
VRRRLNVEIGHAHDVFFTEVTPALQSKLEEFRLLGYDTVTEKDLWGYLTKKKWKKVNEETRLHQIVQDIMGVKVSDYLSFATIKAYREAEVSFHDQEEWKELLK